MKKNGQWILQQLQTAGCSGNEEVIAFMRMMQKREKKKQVVMFEEPRRCL